MLNANKIKYLAGTRVQADKTAGIIGVLTYSVIGFITGPRHIMKIQKGVRQPRAWQLL